MVPVPKTRKDCVFVDTTICFYEHLRTQESKNSVFKVLFNGGTFSNFNIDRSFRGIDWEEKLQLKKPYGTGLAFTVGGTCRSPSPHELYTYLDMQIAL